MRETPRLLTGCLVLPVLLLAAVVSTTLQAAGVFDSLEVVELPGAKPVGGLAGGGEDVTFRQNRRQAFVSSADFSDASFEGRIYLYDVDFDALRDVTPGLDFPLQPHGLDVWNGDGGERLFVVNHRTGTAFGAAGEEQAPEHTVEIFDVAEDGNLTHARTVRGEALTSPNDVAAVGAESFYVTNDHGSGGGLLRLAEDYLRLPWGNVIVFDGSSFREVYDGTRYANGISATADGTSVFLAETTEPAVTWFDRDPATNDLTPVSALRGWVGVDNITFDPSGDLWIGAHPKLLKFTAHARDHAERSPSQVLRVRPQRQGEWQVTVVYANDGEPLSGSSVAASNGDLLLIGTVFEHTLLVAPVP